MMAFFMLMWLLNATTEQQRKGIADYFTPTIPFNRISGGGDGMFGGDTVFARLFATVKNEVAITGHLQAQSVLRIENPIWELSTGRAAALRVMLEDAGLDPARIARMTGAGDRIPATDTPTAPRNNRLEVILLRSDI